MQHEIVTNTRTHIYTSEQVVSGGGSRNCMDWILDSKAQGAQKVIIYVPYALPILVRQIQHYADKIQKRITGVSVFVVRTKQELRKAKFASY